METYSTSSLTNRDSIVEVRAEMRIEPAAYSCALFSDLAAFSEHSIYRGGLNWPPLTFV
jgi:hypothetical protein